MWESGEGLEGCSGRQSGTQRGPAPAQSPGGLEGSPRVAVPLLSSPRLSGPGVTAPAIVWGSLWPPQTPSQLNSLSFSLAGI